MTLAASDLFGYSVAVSGDTAIVGAYGDDDDGGSASGSAYVFIKPVGGWSGALNETAELTASDPASIDDFGKHLAISGDSAIVGAFLDDDDGKNSGSAYVFVKPAGGWSGALNETAKLPASDAAAYDLFGQSVAISGDTAIVGAQDNDGGSASGSAYVFVKPGSGWNGALHETSKLTASASGYFSISYGATTVDQIKITMKSYDQNELLYELFIPMDYSFQQDCIW